MTENFEIKNLDDFNSLLQKAENDSSDAMNEVAFWFENGLTINNVEIVKCNPQLAFDWIKKSHEQGNLNATIRYADYLSNGENEFCQKDVELAMKLYKNAMNEGSSNATFNLGLEYRNKQQFGKAFELYQKANNSDDYFAEFTLGLCYYYGVGTSKDKLKAFEIFKSLDKENYTEFEIDEANYLIGKIYLEGEVVEQSFDLARKYLELADKDGDHRSAHELLMIIGRTKMIN
ncbi:MAG: sel1 repeat family protein [Chitinophagaceae bacterium]|jgi:TPR repeat protein|nr:sel1 repeat family protein [Chitinophagaceae bacterium]MCU0394144.1 sel1 repeat family protein [Thermoflexibacter sp.]